LGGPNRSIKTPASIAIRVTEAHNTPTTKRWQHVGGWWNGPCYYYGCNNIHSSYSKVADFTSKVK